MVSERSCPNTSDAKRQNRIMVTRIEQIRAMILYRLILFRRHTLHLEWHLLALAPTRMWRSSEPKSERKKEGTRTLTSSTT
jgi:hypothetical protein